MQAESKYHENIRRVLMDLVLMVFMADIRIEADTMGSLEVPSDRYYGAQTARSPDQFRYWR